jgi:hypothetical protein
VTTRQHNSTAAETQFLTAEVTRLSAALAATRLLSANRLAAIRAALGAAAEGEADPLAYLRDQLADETHTSGNRGSGR